MVTRIRIRGDFGSGQSIDEEVAKAAARKVVNDSQSTEEALLFLDMLGLIPPQEGYEVKIPKKKGGQKYKKPKVDRLENVRPEEYGE